MILDTPTNAGKQTKLDDLVEWQYVALFETGKKGQQYFKFAYLYCEAGSIAQPVITIGGIEYAYVPDQNWIAKTFNISQQQVSRWLKNKEPLT